MLTLKQFMELVNYRITEGSQYTWNCFGPNAYRLDSWNSDPEGHTITVVFDTVTQVVYQVEAHDYRNNRSYRLNNPLYLKAHNDESLSKGVDPDIAWDDIRFFDLETVEDFLAKAEAIVDGVDYDTSVEVQVDLQTDTILHLALEAHRRSITLNELVNQLLRDELSRITALEAEKGDLVDDGF